MKISALPSLTKILLKIVAFEWQVGSFGPIDHTERIWALYWALKTNLGFNISTTTQY